MAELTHIIALQAATNMFSRTLAFPPIPTTGVLDARTVKTVTAIASMISLSTILGGGKFVSELVGPEAQVLKRAADGDASVFETSSPVLVSVFKQFAAERPDVMSSQLGTVEYFYKKKTNLIPLLAIGAAALFLLKKKGR